MCNAHKIMMSVLAAAVALCLAGGCRIAPVDQINNEPFYGVSKNTDLNQITQKILDAGKRRGFGMKVIAPGHIEAAYVKRDVRAIMDVNYTTEHFSITYKDSANLKYDPAEKTISTHYNKWVNTLKIDIANIYLK